MEVEDFPLPEVVEVLRPYIKPRDEVAAIRRRLHGYLQAQIRTDGVPLTSTNLVEPPTAQLDSPPPTLSGVRKAYWKALKAHTEAQTRYDALETELDQMKNDQAKSSHSHSKPDSLSGSEGYVALLRRREKQRKLTVIERALSDVESSGGEVSSRAVDEVVRRKIGDLPVPPAIQPSLDRRTEVEAKTMELKKAIVATKRRIHEHKASHTSHTLDMKKDLPLQAEIAGFQKALQVLTGWMEEQLAIIANAEAETESVMDSARYEQDSMVETSAEDFEQLYQEYLGARQRLIQSVNVPPETRSPGVEESYIEDSSRLQNTEHTNISAKASAEIMLPFVPRLVHAKQQEQALVQQNAHFRRQLATAEADVERLIRRLADESHLVPPGAVHGNDWAAAASEAAAATEAFVRKRLHVGERSTASATEALNNMKDVPLFARRLATLR